VRNASERCAPASERRGDPLLATAAPATRFVLVEQPGAWGRRALRDSRIAPPILARLLARCHAEDARLLLVRRAHRNPSHPRAYAVADARPGREAIAWGSFEHDDELAEIDPTRFPTAPSTRPVFLVCTHGRRDPCCAARGWPVAVALTAAFPEQTWQCSHVGGDRFAANVVALPHGIYYGRMIPAAAAAVAHRHVEGRLTLPLVRGRSCFPPAVQAAQHFARLELAVDEIDTLLPAGTEQVAADVTAVTLGHGGRRVTVVVRESESEPIPRPTCGTTVASRMREWELVELVVEGS
jgi:hypothetical protein